MSKSSRATTLGRYGSCPLPRVLGAVAGALCMAGVATCFAATAPTVTLNFSGTYVLASCTVQGSADQTVTLPTVSAAALDSAGKTAGSTPFTIVVLCDSGVSTVRAYFESGSTVDTATGNLNLETVGSTTPATNVQISLLNADGSTIKAGDSSTVQAVSVGDGGVVNLTYQARYFATGAATAGPVNTHVTYTLEMP